MYVWMRHNSTQATEVAAHGVALPTGLRIPLRHRAVGEQDIFVALPRPHAVTLAESGLSESGAFRNTLRPGNRTDELFTYDPSAVGFNRAPSETYYLMVNQWRRVNFGTNYMNEVTVFQPGGGVILRLDPKTGPTVWVNPPNY
jgi:uncharacterized protein (TIGR02597 family)